MKDSSSGTTDRRGVIISVGGNAIVRRGGTGLVEEQFRNAERACAVVARYAASGVPVIITHGNGPIVGNIVIRNEAAKEKVPPMPLYICGADSEGGVGFMLQQTIYNTLAAAHDLRDVVAVVTQVVVDLGDPAFKNPAKPVGPYYTAEEAERLSAESGWAMAGQDAGRGYRRVVPSPRPVRVVEAEVVKRLADSGVIVIAAGGGGVPVAERADGTLYGVDAVVDKDFATTLLARHAGTSTIINLTEVDMVYEDYGKPTQKGLPVLKVDEARRLLGEGHFAPGSMGPKIESAVEFIEAGGTEVIITTPELAGEAVEGRAGTRIVA